MRKWTNDNLTDKQFYHQRNMTSVTMVWAKILGQGIATEPNEGGTEPKCRVTRKQVQKGIVARLTPAKGGLSLSTARGGHSPGLAFSQRPGSKCTVRFPGKSVEGHQKPDA
jgi:hypothetical protein